MRTVSSPVCTVQKNIAQLQRKQSSLVFNNVVAIIALLCAMMFLFSRFNRKRKRSFI